MMNVVGETVGRWGVVHYFFNNAGIAVGGEAEHYDARDWDDVIDVNLRGVAYGIQAVYPLMINQREGHIINTASLAGLVPLPGEVSYTATKYAVLGLSCALRIEAKRHNVRVSALCPGAVRTPMLAGGRYGRTNMIGMTEEKAMQIWERMLPMDADEFAGRVVAAVARNQAIIVIPGWWRAVWMLSRLSPGLAERMMAVDFERTRRAIEATGARPAPRPTSQPAVAAGAAAAMLSKPD
jgi:NADP-dependent 3-hydroxy acid dehydrogenase YdfG